MKTEICPATLGERIERAEQEELQHCMSMLGENFDKIMREQHGWMKKSEIKEVADELSDCIDRMERCRNILQNEHRRKGLSEEEIRQVANWGMLETGAPRRVLKKHGFDRRE